MRPGHQDLRPLGCILHFHYIQFDPLRRLEYFTLHLFIFCQHSIGFPEVDTDIFTDITLHDAGYDVFFFLKILIIHYLALFFPDFLQDQVLCILCGNTSKRFGFDRNLHHISQLIFAVDLFCLFQTDLFQLIFWLLYNCLFCQKLIIAGLPVHDQFNVVRLSEMILTGVQQ